MEKSVCYEMSTYISFVYKPDRNELAIHNFWKENQNTGIVFVIGFFFFNLVFVALSSVLSQFSLVV